MEFVNQMLRKPRNQEVVAAELKQNVIKEFLDLLRRINKGYKDSYSDILNKIMCIDIIDKGYALSDYITSYYNSRKSWEFRQF